VRISIEFRLLGPIEGLVGGHPLALGHARQRLVLAALLVDANQLLPADKLIDRVWGNQLPYSVRNTLHGYIHRLRRALSGTARVELVRKSGGSRLLIAPAAVDLHRFTKSASPSRATSGSPASTCSRSTKTAGAPKPSTSTTGAAKAVQLRVSRPDHTQVALYNVDPL
jgi:DNA-binding SARP family transcriptional activator